jgi:hypothetical protein
VESISEGLAVANIERTGRRIIDEIERQGDPSNMTKREWVEFLEFIISECQSRLEGAKDELAEEEGE